MTLIFFLCLMWLLISVFMIMVILVQRGRGGGLAGALGGMGGSSAFGTKSGDTFTKITVGVFAIWLAIGLVLVPMMRARPEVFEGGAQAKQNESEPTSKDPAKDSETVDTNKQESGTTEEGDP